MAQEANYTPYLESIGWKEEWLKDESLIIRVDDIKKLTNGIVFGVVEKFKAQAGEAINKAIWKHLQLLAPPNCPCMQGDKDALNFSKSLKKNKKLKGSKFSKNKIGQYSEPFIFPKTPEVNKNSDGKSATKKKQRNASPTNLICENCPVLQDSISQLQEDLIVKTSQCSELHSHLCSESELFQLEKQSALDKISELEKQLLDFQQKHAILQGELLNTKKELKLCKLKFAGKCSALSKASKPCEDKKDTSKADKIIANEHPNDIIDCTCLQILTYTVSILFQH